MHYTPIKNKLSAVFHILRRFNELNTLLHLKNVCSNNCHLL